MTQLNTDLRHWQSTLEAMGITVWIPRRPEQPPVNKQSMANSVQPVSGLGTLVSIQVLADPPAHPLLVIMGTEQQVQTQRPQVKQLLENILRALFQSTAPLARAVIVPSQEDACIPLAEQLATLEPVACLVFGDCLPPLANQPYPIIYLPSLESCLSDPMQKRVVWQYVQPWLSHWRIVHPAWSQ